MSEAPFAWHQPVQVAFGPGELGRLAPALQGRKVVALVFAAAERAGVTDRLNIHLQGQLLHTVVCPDGLSSIQRSRALAGDLWPLLPSDAVLLAVGGGTVMDLAKVLRCRPLSGRFDDLLPALRGLGPWPDMQLQPLWLAPTTAGTGSEVTRWATVWDDDAVVPVKRSLDEPWGYAERAIVDPLLTHSCPRAVTRDSALDALAHALEAIWNRHANPISNALALQASQRILAALPQVMRNPHHTAAREELALAALEAGMAFSQTRTALAHALSYDLTLNQGVPHGLACAVWLPTAWQLALGHRSEVDELLSQVFNMPALAGRAHLVAWLAKLGVDARPQAVGVQDAEQRVAAALLSPRGRNFLGAPCA